MSNTVIVEDFVEGSTVLAQAEPAKPAKPEPAKPEPTKPKPSPLKRECTIGDIDTILKLSLLSFPTSVWVAQIYGLSPHGEWAGELNKAFETGKHKIYVMPFTVIGDGKTTHNHTEYRMVCSEPADTLLPIATLKRILSITSGSVCSREQWVANINTRLEKSNLALRIIPTTDSPFAFGFLDL